MSLVVTQPLRRATRAPAIHPLIVRVNHWINAAAIVVMILSGLQIYNAYPILPFVFPRWMTLGGWLGGALLWHFAAMWVLMVNFALQISYGFVSGRYRRKLLPLSPQLVGKDLLAAFRGNLGHADISVYNAVQRLLYAGVLLFILLAILSGFALWKPVQLSWLTFVMGGFESARIVHFIAMAGISGFIVLHVAMAVLVPKTLRAMVVGR